MVLPGGRQRCRCHTLIVPEARRRAGRSQHSALCTPPCRDGRSVSAPPAAGTCLAGSVCSLVIKKRWRHLDACFKIKAKKITNTANAHPLHSVLFLKHLYLLCDSSPQRCWRCCLYLSLWNKPGVFTGRGVGNTSLPRLRSTHVHQKSTAPSS